jgi:transcriptional regulator
MYVPAHFSEPSDEVMHALIRACPLGVLVVAGAGGLEANHIPFFLRVADGGQATLLGHVARANPVWRTAGAASAALVVFQGPAGYVSPSWYPSKRENGRVVPTWNYAAVHAQGTVTFHDDPRWTRRQMEWLTHQMEAGREHPWAIADAPAEYIDKLVANVVGVEVFVERLTGKWKVSQNQSDANRAGVVNGLKEAGGSAAAELARLVAEHPVASR